MNPTERKASKERFRKLLASPAIQKSIYFKSNRGPDDGDTKPEFNPKMPSPERIDAVNRLFRNPLT